MACWLPTARSNIKWREGGQRRIALHCVHLFNLSEMKPSLPGWLCNISALHISKLAREGLSQCPCATLCGICQRGIAICISPAY